jgi:hypothetical protein
VDGHPRTLRYNTQLVNGIGALQVGCYQKWGMSGLFEMKGKLAGKGRLTCTLKTREQDDGGWILRVLQATSRPTEDSHEFLVNNLHNLLGGIKGLIYLG